MSAFVVEHTTINCVLQWLKTDRDAEWDRKYMARAAELDLNDPEFYQKLGMSMHMLNVQAVNERYRENQSPDVSYRFLEPAIMPTHNPSRIQVLKSLRCLIYQCSEGSVPETDLYRALDKLAGSIALDIVRDLPAYDEAEWG